MKCYLLMNMASKRNSTISLIMYENWCPNDDYSCHARIAELSKRALGKTKNTKKNDRRGRPTLSKSFWSQEDLDMVSAKCPPDNLPIDMENSYFKEKWNPHLNLSKITLQCLIIWVPHLILYLGEIPGYSACDPVWMNENRIKN